jgi:hypothetical protein
MTRPSILRPGQSYHFQQYFEMADEPDDILAEFGYTLFLWFGFKINSILIGFDHRLNCIE